MQDLAAALRGLPSFRLVPDETIEAAACAWRPLELATGEALWEQGAAVEALAVVVRGGLVGLDGDAPVARVGAGELVGEVSAFFAGQTRSLTLRADGPTRVGLLALPSLRTLRWMRSPVYTALLEHAVVTLAARLRRVDRSITRAATGGDAAPQRPHPGLLRRLWDRLVGDGPRGAAPDPLRTLRRMPGLRDLDDAGLLELAAAFTPEWAPAGRVLCIEGEAADGGWIVAEGRVDVLRLVTPERAERLASLGPGDPVGLLALVDDEPRVASCVAVEDGWLLASDRSTVRALSPDVRRAWLESVIASLGAALRHANHQLAEVREPPGAPRLAPSEEPS